MSLQPGDRVGAYEVIAEIGRGGMGTVYHARQLSLDREVAIKVLPKSLAREPGIRERFAREARVMARLRHPNIVEIHEAGDHDGLPYIVTEFIEGGSLPDRLPAPLQPDDCIRLLEPIAHAIDYAHGVGVVHRDIKPSNILVAADGSPVLTDFGLAKVLDAETRLTKTGTVLGTPAYMSPEQCAGAAVGAAADVYALAVVAYQMLTGRLPFEAATPARLILAQLQDPPPPPRSLNPSLPMAVETALLKALSKSPDARPSTAGEFVAGLNAAAGGHLGPSRRRVLALGGSAAAILAAGFGAGAGYVWLAPRRPPRVQAAAQALERVPTGPLNGPAGIAVDGSGSLLVVDAGTRRVLRITPSGPSPVAPTSSLGAPTAVAVDRAGSIYIADAGRGLVLKVGAGGTVATLMSGLHSPAGLAVDGSGAVYVADAGANAVLVVPASGQPATFAGTGVAGYAGDGGDPRAAQLSAPAGLAAAPDGSVYIADTGNSVIRRVAAGVIATVAGLPPGGYFGDGLRGDIAEFAHPSAVALDLGGALLVADSGNARVRRLDSAGIVTSIASIRWPAGLAVDASGAVLVSGRDDNAVWRLPPPR